MHDPAGTAARAKSRSKGVSTLCDRMNEQRGGTTLVDQIARKSNCGHQGQWGGE